MGEQGPRGRTVLGLMGAGLGSILNPLLTVWTLIHEQLGSAAHSPSENDVVK